MLYNSAKKSGLYWIVPCFFLFPLFLFSALNDIDLPEGLNIEFEELHFSKGVLWTTSGGVVTAKDLRIQAKEIQYIHKDPSGNTLERITAKGALFFQYKGRAFMADSLCFDLSTSSGTLINALTVIDIWCIGAKEISIKSDGQIILLNSFLTASEGLEQAWKMATKKALITNDKLLVADCTTFRLFNIPLFWLPSFKSKLSWFSDPPMRVKFQYDKKIGPKLSLRLRLQESEEFGTYLRLDYRFTKGPGAALETRYSSLDGRKELCTKNYGGFDKILPEEVSNRRYRLKGQGRWISENQKTEAFIQWDRLRDHLMPEDFSDLERFEVNGISPTRARISHYENQWSASLDARLRLNPFQSDNEKLPELAIFTHPYQVGKMGLFSQQKLKTGYLDYTFDNTLRNDYPALHPFHAFRLACSQSLFRPCHISFFTVTPKVEGLFIHYSNNPFHHAKNQGLILFDALATTQLKRRGHCSHLIMPYIAYKAASHTLASLPNHWIFNVEDGYINMQQLRLGLTQTLYHKGTEIVECDLYADAFYHAKAFRQTIPRLYGIATLHTSSTLLQTSLIWNLEHQQCDLASIRLLWTLSPDIALSWDARYRSRFYWRKCQTENFFMEFARSEEELLDSALSDERLTLLLNMRIRFSPRFYLDLRSHQGWRFGHFQPSYHAADIEFASRIFPHLELRSKVQFSPRLLFTPHSQWEFSFSLKTVK